MTPNLRAFIERFDKESYWVATEICMVKDLKARAKVLKRWIHVVNVGCVVCFPNFVWCCLPILFRNVKRETTFSQYSPLFLV